MCCVSDTDGGSWSIQVGDQTLLHAGVCSQALRGGWDREGPSQEMGGGHSGQENNMTSSCHEQESLMVMVWSSLLLIVRRMWSWARSFPNPNNSLHKDLTVMLGKENIPDASQAVLHNISS